MNYYLPLTLYDNVSTTNEYMYIMWIIYANNTTGVSCELSNIYSNICVYNSTQIHAYCELLVLQVYSTTKVNTLDLHLFMMSINSFLPIPVSRNASAALKLGMLS